MKLHPTDEDKLEGKSFLGCKYCFWACCATSRRSAKLHLQNDHSEKNCSDLTWINHFHKGVSAQKYCGGGGDHIWFQVYPELTGVVKGSDFDLFVRSISNHTESANASLVANDPRSFDLSPFLYKTGWPKHIEDFSRTLMVRMSGQIRPNEPVVLKRISNIAMSYLERITSVNLTDVDPSQLARLNSWKK